jgi:hypothetical protein
MSAWEMKIITAEARRLIGLAAEDADLRAALRALAREILAATETPDPQAEPTPAVPPTQAAPANAADAVSHDPAKPEPTQGDRVPEREPLRELTLGRRAAPPTQAPHPPGRSARPEADVDDLGRIESRCRSKAEAARRAAERQRRALEGTDPQVEDAPADPEIAAWAGRLTDCFYWQDAPDIERPPDIALLDDVGGCFEAVADGLSLVAECGGRRGAIERAMPLLAEAQSMLRRALRHLQAPDDPDQLAVYERVREIAARHRIYLKRHMRADDLADPSRWPDLRARIEALTGGGPQGRRHRSRIVRIRHHLEVIREGHGTDQDWQEVIGAVDEMVGDGVPPSHREVRDLLLPVIDDLPDRGDLPPGFRLVLREIDRSLATTATNPEATSAHEPTAEVKESARLLKGRSVVLIGGDRRPEAEASLVRALSLRELVWIETKEHQPVASFESAIARPEVALVLLAIRWSSHSFGEVRQSCDRLGKPLVRLPGGYNPNQVAAQILSQCGERLRGG